MIDATVIVAAWNASDTIEACITSAAQQTGVSVETIVIDDRSEDDTARRASASGARVARLPSNSGPSAARNLAIEMAQGTWVAVLDSDDTMLPGRLERMIAHARRHDADVVLGNLTTQGEYDPDSTGRPFLSGPKYSAPRQLSLEDYLGEDQAFSDGRSLGYLKPLIRLSFLRDHKVRYDTRLRNSEDCHLVLECFAKGGTIIFAPEPDYRYTVRAGSISHRPDPADIAALVTADREFSERYASVLSAEAKALLAKRLTSVQSLGASETILRDLKARRVGKALSGFIGNRSARRRVFRQLWESVQKRTRVGSQIWKP